MKTASRIWAVTVAVALIGITGCAAGSGNIPASPSTGSPKSSAEGSAQAATSVITIRNFKFEVPTTIKPGSMVTVTNADSAPHTVTAKDNGGFDVAVDPGETAVFKAPDSPGEYRFVCSFHSRMTGTLIVK
ncbi:plastocyanin [Arthrobacter sp. AG367]|jgi:plastocyanin|uniref:cupredoxin domain-containing protein n=1 Tax=Arthrobacter sp. AG367 TaxID=2572909 RepID=UPI0011AC6147|nr:cupredoxin domain-containing protein [Arthrobacter sp. AG367]TWD48143.1 plastocyanin [Arthrobacter sp. AG367]